MPGYKDDGQKNVAPQDTRQQGAFTHISQRSDQLEQTAPPPAFRTLFELISDAIIYFNHQGTVVASNHFADELFNYQDIVGRQIQDLFYHFTMERAPHGTVPFPLDGSGVTIFACPAPDILFPVEVYCKPYQERGETYYLLLAKNADLARENERERERLLHQLTRANARLEGMLEIISSTLGSQDFEELTQSVLDTLTEVMESDNTLLYLVEEGGYRLSGASRSVQSLKVGHFFIPHFKGLPGYVDMTKSSIYLQFLEPFDSVPARALDLKNGNEIHVESVMNSIFKTAIGLPLYSGDTLVGVILLLWTYPLVVMDSDLNLMETIADYLSLEFTAALSLKRHRKQEQLDYLLSQVRESFYSNHAPDRSFFHSLLNKVRELLPFEYVLVLSDLWSGQAIAHFADPNSRRGICKLDFPFRRGIDFPVDKAERVDARSTLGTWISQHSDLSHGVFLHLGELFDSQVDMFALRPASSVPFDTSEFEFLSKFAETLRESVEGERERSGETKISHVLQRALRNELPHIDGVNAHGLYSSATEQAVVGGDYFDLFELNDNKIAIIMGDISGKGIEAASMASLVKTAIAAYAWNDMDPAHIVSSLNKLFLNFSRIETFTTLFVAIIDLDKQEGQYCCAGHPPAFLYKPSVAGGGELELLTYHSPIVGAFEDMEYRNGGFTYNKGDILYLYTDGTTEARSPEGGFFGEAALRECFLAMVDYGAEELNENILTVLEHFTQGRLKDDIAMVTLEFVEPTEKEAQALRSQRKSASRARDSRSDEADVWDFSI